MVIIKRRKKKNMKIIAVANDPDELEGLINKYFYSVGYELVLVKRMNKEETVEMKYIIENKRLDQDKVIYAVKYDEMKFDKKGLLELKYHHKNKYNKVKLDFEKSLLYNGIFQGFYFFFTPFLHHFMQTVFQTAVQPSS